MSVMVWPNANSILWILDPRWLLWSHVGREVGPGFHRWSWSLNERLRLRTHHPQTPVTTGPRVLGAIQMFLQTPWPSAVLLGHSSKGKMGTKSSSAYFLEGEYLFTFSWIPRACIDLGYLWNDWAFFQPGAMTTSALTSSWSREAIEKPPSGPKA